MTHKTQKIATPPGTMKIESVPLDSLTLDDSNTNRHTQRGLDAIKASLSRFGQQKPIVVDRDNVVRAGNGTYQAARALGWTEILVVRTDLKGADKRAWAHADNRSARFSRDDEAEVARLLVELEAEDDRLVFAAGYTDEEKAALLDTVEAPRTRDADEIPDVPRKPVSRRGDVWDLGPHRIICGDSTQAATFEALLRRGERAACVFTDPPYGVAYNNQKFGPEKSGKPKPTIAGDAETGQRFSAFLAEVLREAVARTKDTGAFYIWHASTARDDVIAAMLRAGLQERQYLIWTKTNHVLSRHHYQWAHEPCFYAAKAGHNPEWHGDRTSTTVWRIGTQGRNAAAYALAGGLVVTSPQLGEIYLTDRRPKGKKGLRVVRMEEGGKVWIDANSAAGTVWEVAREHADPHPTAKPVELARRALANSTKREDIVLDPFLGGGCTLIGAEQTGRICRGIEIEPGYVDVAVKRWQDLTAKRATCSRKEARIS